MSSPTSSLTSSDTREYAPPPAAPFIEIPPPPHALLHILSHPDGCEAFGLADFSAMMTGLADCTDLRFYVDGVLQGQRMEFLERNRWTQAVDTARWPCGPHRIAVAAVDAEGRVLCTREHRLLFRNIGSIQCISILPQTSGRGFVLALRINTARVELAADRFECVDRVRRIALSTRIEYHGDLFNGTPLATLFVDLPHGELLSNGPFQLRVTVKDSRDVPLASTYPEYVVGHEDFIRESG